LFVVTNQSGVARGFFTEDAVVAVHDAMQAALPKDVRFSDLAYCPHHPNGIVAVYSKACDCRKPAPGMIDGLIKRHRINRQESFLIGDKESDVDAAKSAGIEGFRFLGGNLDSFVAKVLQQK
jgi:D-glycero-D-manno-heptose 1,7-bisphosphate phosphatase